MIHESKQVTLFKCPKCGQYKERDQFGSRSTTEDGMRWECRACQNEYARLERLNKN
jgi:predicted RNA-binding Zn-ribbon protein involved in translation (DUF1610 family)